MKKFMGNLTTPYEKKGGRDNQSPAKQKKKKENITDLE